MTGHTIRILGALAPTAVVMGLAGCAGPAGQEAMSVNNLSLAKQHAQSVSVQARGGNETGAMDSTNIANEEFKAAIEQSIVKNNLFKSVIQGNTGDYELVVTISQLSKPVFGLSFTVDMEAGWVLTRTADKSVAMKKSIKSSHTATAGDALVGATRIRLAVEGAARKNIEQGLQAIAELNL